MSTPDLAPRGAYVGVVAVWVVAALLGVAIGVFVPPEWKPEWAGLAAAGCLILSFAVQLAYGSTTRFIQRVAAGALGSFMVLGVISGVFALVDLLS